jgi:hypothetical protein
MPIEIAVGLIRAPAFDFEHELFAAFLNIRRKRINPERLLKIPKAQDHAHVRERAKMVRQRSYPPKEDGR